MADPYATEAPDLSARPMGAPPWAEAVAARGGVPLGTPSEAGGEVAFLFVHCRGVGTLAPIARVEPALATLLWLEHSPESRSGELANEMLKVLRAAAAPILSIKQGCVGGPSDRPGCVAVESDLIEAVLDGIDASVTWESDSDFGYEVPADVPGLSESRARALLPRLLYGDHDRVYEHADLVARKKRERYELARSFGGLDDEVIAAAGWPPRATGDGWRT